MKWSKTYPTEPGFYWVIMEGEEPHLVEVGIESDSHRMLYVLQPGDTNKYSIELWSKAYWYGPIASPH